MTDFSKQKNHSNLDNLYESILKNMSEGIIVQDEKGDITFVNQATVNLLHYEPVELIGKNWRIVIPKNWHSLMENIDADRKKGKVSRYEIELVRKDKKRIPVLVSGSPQFHEGRFTGTVAVFTDMTEYKKAQKNQERWTARADLIWRVGQRVTSNLKLEQLLNETVSSIRDTFDYYGVQLFLYDEKNNKLVLQAIAGAYEKVFPEKMSIDLGKGLIGRAGHKRKTQVSGDVSKNPHYIKKTFEDTHSELAVAISSKDGLIGVLDLQSAEYHAFDDSDVSSMESLCTQIASAIENARLYEKAQKEIADRKLAEQQTKESERKYRVLFNNIADPVLIFDKENHKILDWNKSFKRIYGYSKNELQNMTPYDLHPEEELERVKRQIDVRNVDYGFSYTHITKYGRKIIVEIQSEEITYQGNPAWISSIRNITERKLLENQLKDFAYIVSHDLKAPLRAISQLASWLAEDYADVLDDNGREQLELLLGRVKRMDRLIIGILQYSRAGRKSKRLEKIDLQKLVPEVIEILSPPENIKIHIKSSLPTIYSEKIKIEQIFQNLISNAIKYNDKSQGKIEIGCHEEPSHWRFSITDNGPGIEERYYEKIFKIFQTLEARDRRESTGVGLSVVKNILDSYGEKIWVESKVGQWTSFYFTYKKQLEDNIHTLNG
ncbi:MAG: PAS domain S-box protein [Candidatus Aminicenantes bacterium]|nr:PAS domain S-box protein [Candidatus Aminicenantes bacterium]